LRSAYPRTNTEETWLRGAWATDSRGVAQFSSKCVWEILYVFLLRLSYIRASQYEMRLMPNPSSDLSWLLYRSCSPYPY
jgi:hypothetical protein